MTREVSILSAALKRVSTLENEIYEEDGIMRQIKQVEHDRAVEHARCLFWTMIRSQGFDPLTMEPIDPASK